MYLVEEHVRFSTGSEESNVFFRYQNHLGAAYRREVQATIASEVPPRAGACDDTVTALGRSLVRNGQHNDRAFLYHLDPADFPEIAGRLWAFAEERGYSRIFARIPATALDQFV